MAKLIQTSFDYEMKDHAGRWEKLTASYLGRKPATLATIKRHLTATRNKYGASWVEFRNVVVGESFVSPWIHQ